MNKTVGLILTAMIILIAAGSVIWNRSTQQEVVMYKSATCHCCTKWAGYLEKNGFSVLEKQVVDLLQIKSEFNIPVDLYACHTAVIGDYIVEGHVPLKEVLRMLEEKPNAAGLAVPGMPIGSPGMEGPGPEPYQV